MKSKSFLRAGVSLLALLAAPAAARAACPTTAVDETCTNAATIGTITSSGDLDLTNTSTGTIDAALDTGNFGIVDTTSTDTNTIDNAGTIRGAWGLYLHGALTLTNRSGAVITGSSYAEGIYSNYAGQSTIVNDGTIEGNLFGMVLDGDLDLTNTGSIFADHFYGIAVGGAATVTNSGTIKGFQYGLTVGGDLTLDNSGLIEGDFLPGAGAGVRTGGATTVITNSGSIYALNGDGIYASNAAAGSSFTLNNSGAIGGIIGVHTTASLSTIVNSGTISDGFIGISATGALNLTNKGVIEDLTGISVTGPLDLTNSGRIYGILDTGVLAAGAVTATNSGLIHGNLQAFSVAGDLTLVNSGTIETAFTGSTVAVEADGLTNVITNSRRIRAFTGIGIDATNGSAGSSLTVINSVGGRIEAATGIDTNNVSTVIDNFGTIDGGGNYGSGILAENASANAFLSLTNSGTITATFGVSSQVVTTTVDNSGHITGTGGGGVSAVNTAANASLALTNSGTIIGEYGAYAELTTTTVDNSGTLTGDTAGIFARSSAANASLALANTGTIIGDFEGISSQLATTTIGNSGTVTGSSAYGIGVFALSSLTNASLALSNSGTITGYYAVESQVATTTIGNSGTIAGTGDIGKNGVFAYSSAANASLALSNSGTITGYFAINSQVVTTTIGNSGTIAGTGGFGNDSVYAYSAAVSSSLALTNSGTISGWTAVNSQVATTTIDNSGTIAGDYYGILATGKLTLTNTGLISSGYKAVQLGVDGNSLTLGKGARFVGAIDYARTTGNTTRFGPGSWILNVANYNAANNTILTTGGSPYAVTSSRIVVADASSLQAGQRSALDITRSLSNLAGDALSLSPSAVPVAGSFGGALAYADDNIFDREFTSGALTGPSQDNPLSRFTNGSVGDGAGNIVWSRAFAGRSIAPQDEASAASWTNYVGGAVGGDHRFSDTLRLGGFLGLANSHSVSDGGSSLESTLYYAGLYGRWSPGAAFLEATLTAGYADNRSERQVTTGLATETAVGKYGSAFFSPELAVGYRFALQPGVSLTPQLRARYLGIDAQGYAETGSSANMTVSSHYSGFLEERALAKLEFDNERWSLFTTLGAVALQRVQGNGTNVSLLGITSTVAEGKASLNGASFGLGGNVKVSDAVSLFGALNGTVMTDNAASIDANAGVKVTF